MGCRLLDQVAGDVVDAAGGRPLTVDPQDEIVQPLCLRLVAQTLWVARWRGIWHTGTQLWNAMPCRIGVPDSVVQRIRVPVQRLRIARVGDDGVGLRESAQLRVVVASSIIVQPDCSIFALACKAPRGQRRAAVDARLTPRSVEQFAQLRAVGPAGGDVRAAEVVWEQVVGHPTGAHRDPPVTGVVVPPGGCALLDDRSVDLLVMVADACPEQGRKVDGGAAVHE